MYSYRFVCLMGLLLLGVVSCGKEVAQGKTNSVENLTLHGAVISPPRNIDDFALEATTGATFHLSEYRGKVVLLYFGYLSCPDVCPTTSMELSRAYQALGEPVDQVTVVFITVDPTRDTLSPLGKYMNAFHADFIGLRGEEDQIQPIKEQFGIKVTRHDYPDSALQYTLDHTAGVFVIGPDGKLIEQILYGAPYTDIVEDVNQVLQYYPH